MTQVQLARVLVAVDFDDTSAAALAAAGALAGAVGARITAVHAETFEMPAYFTEAQMDALEADREERRATLTREVDAFAARHTHVPVHAIVREGQPAQVILELASGFDLLVLGTRRLHGPRRWWLGSVAEAVVRESDVPVLVVPAADDGPAWGRGTTIVAAASDRSPLDAWLTTLERGLGGHVVQAAEIDRCGTDQLAAADVLVVPLWRRHNVRSQLDTVAHVLKECAHPVLFVPVPEPVLERNSS